MEAGRKREPDGRIAEGESRAVQILAQQAGLAIQNARLFEAVKKREAQVRAAFADLQAAEEELLRRERLGVLGELAGGIAHELRNPLTAIRNSAYLLSMSIESSDARIYRHLGTIDRQVDAANKIINDLLSLAANKAAERQRLALGEIVRDALAVAAVPPNVDLRVRLDHNLPPVMFDPSHLRQILINLITNAYQAMPEGGELDVAAECDDGAIRLTIRDTGGGIAEQNLRKIFQPLYSTKARGIGLGLALAKRLAEVNEATIGVESEFGFGSTFTITMPTVDQQEPQAATPLV
jgi:signal transduction histidine kinase